MIYDANLNQTNAGNNNNKFYRVQVSWSRGQGRRGRTWRQERGSLQLSEATRRAELG
jgi:biotin-(acetyl-CoA carboxylase) ligase